MTRVFLVFLLTSTSFAVPFIVPPKGEISKLREGALVLSSGTVWFELFPEEAPLHVANLKWLSEVGFFKDRPISDFQPGYIVQFGKLKKNEMSRFLYTLPPEFSERVHEAGSLSMGRVPDSRNPKRESSSTTIHVLLKKTAAMDGNFTVFGRVTEGLHLFSSNSVIKDLVVYVAED